jgi:effector-binding domain-containing protein
MFNPFETAFVDSLKTYYDSFQFFIESDYYTEKSMITSYDYESLSDFNREDVLMGIEVNRSFDKELNLKDVQVVELNKGKYLSIYYIFREGKFDELKDLKKKIDEYLDENQLKVDSKIVLEIERPEFSLILDENSMLYEIQIKVRKAFHE